MKVSDLICPLNVQIMFLKMFIFLLLPCFDWAHILTPFDMLMYVNNAHAGSACMHGIITSLMD